MIFLCNEVSLRYMIVGGMVLIFKSDSDLAELGGKGYVKFDLSAREFDLCAR